ncbi:MAG TPA: hypothetical protein VLB44_21485, partial [Kofleriaceae bacterium]|nr:hypothetical protein [Kofleriaceae bacterium]
FLVRWSIEAVDHATAAGVDPSDSIRRIQAELAAIDRSRANPVEEPPPAWRRGDAVVALARATNCSADIEAVERYGTDVDTWFATLNDLDDMFRVLYATGVDGRTLIALALDQIEPAIGSSANARAVANTVRGMLAGDEPIEVGLVWYRRAIPDQPGGLRPGRPGGVPLELGDDRGLVQSLADLALAFEHRTVAQALRRYHEWGAAREAGAYHGDAYHAVLARLAHDTCRHIIEHTRVGDALVPADADRDPIERWDSRSRAWGLLQRLGASTEQILAARDADWSVTDWWAHSHEPAAMLGWLQAQPLAPDQAGAMVAGIVDRLADRLPAKARIARLALARGRAGGRDIVANATAHGALVEAHTLAQKISVGEVSADGRDPRFAASIARRVIEACALTGLWHLQRRAAKALASCLTEASALLDPDAAEELPLDDDDLVARHRATVADWIRAAAPTAFAIV